jgi:uncharacterized protein
MTRRDPRGLFSSSDRERKGLLSVAAVVGVLAVSSLEACRKTGPDEIVNTGQFHPPTLGPLPGSGGASIQSGSGGTASGAVGGTGNGLGGSSSGSGGTSGEAGAASDAGSGGTAGVPDPGTACDPITPSTEPFSKRLLLQATSACARRQYCLFQEAAIELRDRAAEYSSEPSDETAAAARDAWREAMAVWEEAELFQFGPAATGANPGGRDLRDLVHSWPLIARCKVDEHTVSKFYERDSFFGSAETSPSSGRTLHALEYLLFYGGVDNGCSPYASINSTRSWANLGAAEIRSRKIQYAARAAEDVLRRADALVDAWSPEGGDFGTILAEARSPFTTEQKALNCVNDGLFYVDRQLKDLKLALPLGMHDECPADRCPAAVEALYAGTSIDHIRRNLAGFRKLFQGCAEGNAGIGFDDWLMAVGAGDLATRMLGALEGAEIAVAGLDAPLEQLVSSDPARVEAVHAALKRFTDLFKAEFMTVLNLEPPGGPGGGIDND